MPATPEPYSSDIALDAIVEGENLSREYYGDIDALAKAIAQNAWCAPLQVSKDGKRYRLGAGYRRYRALLLLRERGEWGDSAPCQVFTSFDDAKLAAINAAENQERLQPNLAESVNTYRQLHERYSLSKGEIALRMGKSVQHVGNCIRVAKSVHPTILAAVRNGGEHAGFTLGQLISLASKTPAEQLQWLQQRSISAGPRESGSNAEAADDGPRMRRRREIEKGIKELKAIGDSEAAFGVRILQWVLGQRSEPWE